MVWISKKELEEKLALARAEQGERTRAIYGGLYSAISKGVAESTAQQEAERELLSKKLADEHEWREEACRNLGEAIREADRNLQLVIDVFGLDAYRLGSTGRHGVSELRRDLEALNESKRACDVEAGLVKIRQKLGIDDATFPAPKKASS